MTAPTFENTNYGSVAVADNGTKLSWVKGKTVDQGAPPLSHQTLGEMLRDTVERYPQKDCIIDVYADVSFTYERFYNRVLRLASAMVRNGIKRGDRVGIWSTNRWEWLVVQWACHHLGLVLVNINPAYRQEELNYALEKTGTRVVFAARRFKDSDYRTMLNEAKRQKGVKLERVVYFGGAEWYEAMHGEIDDLSTFIDGIDEHDPANIQFTSGTTGFAKGVTLTHHNLLNNGRIIAHMRGYKEDDRMVVPVPFFHVFGMTVCEQSILSVGGTVIIAGPTFNPRETLKSVQAAKATIIKGVPTMLITCMVEADDQEEYGSPYNLSTLRSAFMAGTMVPTKTMREVSEKFDIPDVANGYGMTETAAAMFIPYSWCPDEKKMTTVGLITPHAECKLIDPATGEIVPLGQEGELVVKGYNVMKGYWRHEEKTAEAFTEDGYLYTGDLGVMDEDGYMTITGRSKDLVIRGGENIAPREVEEFLYTHPDILEAQVIGVPDDKYGEELMAYIIMKADTAPLSQEQIAEYAMGRITRHKIPRYVHVVDSYPMTVSGKVRKVELREMAPKILGWV